MRYWLHGLLVALAATTLFLWLLGPPVDFDLWFDLKLGELIVRTHSVPHSAVFLNNADAFALPYWMNDEWLFCVTAYGVWCLGGAAGLALFKALLITACFGVLLAACRRAGLPLVPTLGLLWLVLFVASSRFMLRPQLVTDLALAVLVLLLLRREQGGRSGLPWIVAPFFALWANFHAGVVAGVVLLFMWTFADTVEAWRRGEAAAVRPLYVACGLGLAATLLTPGNVHLLDHLILTFAKQRSVAYIIEWDPLGRSALLGPFGGLVALEALAVAAAMRQRRARLSHVLVMAAFTLFAQRHTRAQGELAAVVPPLIAGALAPWLAGFARPRLATAASGLAALALGAALLTIVRQPQHFDYREPGDIYPIGAARWMERHPVAGNVFNSYHFGGWLAWRGITPFIHGMTATYAESRFDAFLEILAHDERRAALLDRYGIRACILAYPLGKDTHLQTIQWLARQPDWHLVAWDDAALLFVRGPPPTPPYAAVNPALDPPFRATDHRAIAAELERAHRESPRARMPRRLLAELALQEGRLDEALALCDALLAEDAVDYEAWMKRGVLHMKMGQVDAALVDLRTAVRYGPGSVIARFDLAQACLGAAALARDQGRAADSGPLLDEGMAALQATLRLDPSFAPAQRVLGQVQGKP